MLTNTFTPHVGGVARSVERFTAEYQRMGHEVVVVAPTMPDAVPEPHVMRVPALTNVLGSSFALPLLTKTIQAAVALGGFVADPQVVHAHHPFLLGEVARKLSDLYKIPLVYTNHAMYDVMAESLGLGKYPLLPQMAAQLATEFTNSCDRVIAPSESTREMLQERGVRSPIDVVPTGLDVERFAAGNRQKWRKRLGIPEGAPVVGHVGRLAPEKNLDFLGRALVHFLAKHPQAHFLCVGDGSAAGRLRDQFSGEARFHATGALQGADLVDAYSAFDVFAFSSTVETQGMVLVEAMATGAPVVAVDAPGARDVVRAGVNGILVPKSLLRFVAALSWALERAPQLRAGALRTAQQYSQAACAARAITVYRRASYTPKLQQYATSVMRRVLG